MNTRIGRSKNLRARPEIRVLSTLPCFNLILLFCVMPIRAKAALENEVGLLLANCHKPANS